MAVRQSEIIIREGDVGALEVSKTSPHPRPHPQRLQQKQKQGTDSTEN